MVNTNGNRTARVEVQVMFIAHLPRHAPPWSTLSTPAIMSGRRVWNLTVMR